MNFGEYSFIPWLRRGIANQMQTPARAASRAALGVTVRVRSDTAPALDVPPMNVSLIGPGDIIGMHAQMVFRTEPRATIANFEPNYLACVDFYDEDFPWRYTPDVPDTARHRLTPWITLIVLNEQEFKPLKTRPLPGIELTAAANLANILPPKDQLWAWAHVHFNATVGDRVAPNLDLLGTLLRQTPDLAYSRLMSPRRLQPNTRYHGFVIPTFEVGRLAGFGDTVPDATSGLTVSWDANRAFPIYYQWSFSTGAAGDFEDLVRALVPRDIDPRVGIRAMDVQQPGFRLPLTTGQPDDILGLEGVLLAPTTVHVPVAAGCNLPAALAAEANRPADAQVTGVDASDDEDPVISVPLYGRWHALVDRVQPYTVHRNWINELNTDPRFRTVAGMGTKVIQTNQETYMQLAWEQIGDIIAMNRTIAYLQLSVKTSDALYRKNLMPLNPGPALAFASPVMQKVLGSPVTVDTLVRRSRLPRAALSGAFRKQVRARGPLARRALGSPDAAAALPIERLITGLNDGTLTAAPPRPQPTGSTYEQTLTSATPATPDWLRWLAANRTWLLAILLAVLAVIALAGGSLIVAIIAVAAGIGAVVAYRQLTAVAQRLATVDLLQPDAMTPAAIAALPPNDAFVLPDPDVAAPPMPGGGGADSTHGAAFRQAAIDFATLFSDRPLPLPPREPLALVSAHASVMAALRPAQAFSARHAARLSVGARSFVDHAATYHDVVAIGSGGGVAAPPEPRFVPVMAYPDIKLPMYRPLKDLQKDDFVPNLQLVPPDTISLMLTNPPVIESYMVGLNHEFARELLWREYPTDQRPSSFRQFWDPAVSVDTKGLSEAELAKKLRDIPPIHTWPAETTLGKHNNRLPNDDRPRVVLLIRGELLKRYPNTIIYAQRAHWGDAPDHQNDLTLYDETGAKAVANAQDPNFAYPMFRAQVQPDIYAIGFDLLLDDVRGDPTLAETAEARARIPATRLGWFFVLQEVVGEPRFGLDDEAVKESEDKLKWDNLAWPNLGPAVTLINVGAPLATDPPGTDTGGAVWGSHSADMAFILYQRPMLVAIHARDMLKNLTAPA